MKTVCIHYRIYEKNTLIYEKLPLKGLHWIGNMLCLTRLQPIEGHSFVFRNDIFYMNTATAL